MELYQPFLMQAKIHQCPAVEVLAGGQAGPGKTRALTEDAIAAARNDYQARIIIFRQTMDELLKMIDDSRRFIDGGKVGEATYN